MTLNVSVTDDQLGQYFRRTTAIADRLGKSLTFKKVMGVLQLIHDGQFEDGQVTQVVEPKPTPSILELVSTIVVSATTSKFVAKDRFVVDIKRNAPVKISAVWDNFTTWFLSGKSKTEDPISKRTLRYHKLRQSSVDGPIIAELGGEAKAETTLSEMFSLMKKQGKGENGVLLNNGYANIFYIKDQNGVRRAVFVRWGDVGWGVYALSVGRPPGWLDGHRVFSRNSVLESLEPSALAQA